MRDTGLFTTTPRADATEEIWLWHGTFVAAETILREGLRPGRHGVVFLTDNAETALHYAETDQDKAVDDHLTVVRVRAIDLDPSRLFGDIDHTAIDDWRDILRETDQCMHLGPIRAILLTIDAPAPLARGPRG